MKVNFIDLKKQYAAIKDEVQQQIDTVLNHGQYILGAEVQELETALCNFSGSKYCVTCSNGTDALLLAFMAIGIKPGDEVILPAYSYFASAEMLPLIGAKPVFVDIERETFNIDAKLIEQAITPKTKAILPVSLFGQMADMDLIQEIATKHNLKVIEDGAQSFGAAYKGKKSCSMSDLSTTSFFPAKPLGCYGDGGAVFTNDEAIYNDLLSFRFHGQESKNYHTKIGINGRMNTLQCAIMLPKLKRFSWELEQRQRIADNYTQAFSKYSDRITTPFVAAERSSVWAQYTLCMSDREGFQAKMTAEGIPTAIYYPRGMHQQPVFEEFYNGSMPNTEWVSEKVISLPMFPDMSESEQATIIDAVDKSL